MIRDLMLQKIRVAADVEALNTAIALAREFRARLTVVEPLVLSPPIISPWDIAPNLQWQQLYADARQQCQEAANALRERLDKEGVSFDIQVREPFESAHYARLADLSIVGAPAGEEEEALAARQFLPSLLLETGRPLLVVPGGRQAVLPARRIVVAWQTTRESARALHDALPLLGQAESVDIVSIVPGDDALRRQEEPGADVAAHLARHGIKVNVITRPRGEESVASALLHQARESAAHLIVAGGYGHSRLRQWLFGGTTRELLARTPVPLLLAH